MPLKNNFKKITVSLLKNFLIPDSIPDRSIGRPGKILIIRQHNQFGDLLASVSLFRAVKESFPDSHLTLIASLENYYAVTNNEYIDELFIYDKKKLFNRSYFNRLKTIIKREYDLAVVPATVAVSLTSCLIAAFANARIKIGPSHLNGAKNELAYVFHHGVNLDWRRCPDAHVADFILDIVRPFGIKTRNFKSAISFTKEDEFNSGEFLKTLPRGNEKFVIGFHVGAGKPQNRWSLNKYVELIELIRSNHEIRFYFTGSRADNAEINFMNARFGDACGYFIDRTIPELAALIEKSSFFITNDTGVMHVAGTTGTPQISLFGPTNPFNWAPIGAEKYFIRKSEFIDDISVEDVYNLFEKVAADRLRNDDKK